MGNTQEASIEAITQYADQLHSWAVYRTNNPEFAQDLVQDTYYAAIKSLSKFENKSNVKTWLFSILNNKIFDYHRKNFKNIIFTNSQLSDNDERYVLETHFDSSGSWKRRDQIHEWDETDENPLNNPEFNDLLQECLEDLPAKWFSAVQMKYLLEKDGSEICKELDISPSNFWQILHRSKLKLKGCLERKMDN